MADTNAQRQARLRQRRRKAVEIIDRIQAIIDFGNRFGVVKDTDGGAKLLDIERLIERYRRGEA